MKLLVLFRKRKVNSVTSNKQPQRLPISCLHTIHLSLLVSRELILVLINNLLTVAIVT